MMFSPEMYLERVKEYDYDQLIEEREGLIESLKRYEAGDVSREDLCTKPSPDSIYRFHLLYLAKLCEYMSDKYDRDMDWDGGPELYKEYRNKKNER